MNVTMKTFMSSSNLTGRVAGYELLMDDEIIDLIHETKENNSKEQQLPANVLKKDLQQGSFSVILGCYVGTTRV